MGKQRKPSRFPSPVPDAIHTPCYSEIKFSDIHAKNECKKQLLVAFTAARIFGSQNRNKLRERLGKVMEKGSLEYY